MEWIADNIRFVLLETIWGVFAVAAIASLLATGLVKVLRLKRSGNAIVLGSVLVSGLAMMYFVTGEERYRFERETRAQLESAPWVKIVETAYWGDIVAPRTWFSPPVGAFQVAQPDPTSGWSDAEPSLKVTLLRYNMKPESSHARVYCDDKDAIWSHPDEQGFLRTEPDGPRELTDKEYETFCKTDWRAALELMARAANAK